jgi:2-methylcitrate dehydratase PrpD
MRRINVRTTSQLAEYICNTGYEDIAPEVIARTKDLCLSTLGSAALGCNMEVVRIIANYASTAEAPEEAGAIGLGFRTSAELAGFLNSSSAHCTELEDVSFPEAMPTLNVIPALFALGEKLKAPGKKILEGIVLAFEVCARPGTVLVNGKGGAFDRGFQPGPQLAKPAVAGVAGKMLGLDFERIRNALSIGTSFSSGLHRHTGRGSHVVEPGLACRDGLTAAYWAKAGMTGEPTIMEDKSGFWDALAGKPEIDFELGTGRNFRIMAVGMKRYPCCYLLQRIIDGVSDIVTEHGIHADQVDCVEVQGNLFFRQNIRQDAPTTAEEARFSLPHAVAAALTRERIFVETFTAEKVNDPRLQALWQKVKFLPHPDWEGGAMESDAPLTIKLKDGREFHKSCLYHRGDPRQPLMQAEIIERFGYCTEKLFSRSRRDEIAAMVYDLDRLDNVSPLMELLTYPSLAG